MKHTDKIAASAVITISHGLYNRTGNRIGLSLSELRHELEVLESDEHPIKSAIEKASNAAVKKVLDEGLAFSRAAHASEPLGVTGAQLEWEETKAHASEQGGHEFRLSKRHVGECEVCGRPEAAHRKSDASEQGADTKRLYQLFMNSSQIMTIIDAASVMVLSDKSKFNVLKHFRQAIDAALSQRSIKP